MKNLKNLFSALCIALIAVCFNATALGQNKVANMTSSGSSVRWDVTASNAGLVVTISAPDGQVFRKESREGSAEIKLVDSKGERLPDGLYAYELRVIPIISSTVKETLSKARAKGNDEEVGRDLRKSGALPVPVVESGSFSILNGSVVLPGSMDEPTSKRVAQVTTPARPFRATTFRPTGGVAMNGFKRHHAVLNPFFDFVIADDLIVQGSACVGLDCVDGESFGFDTIRVKENNTRIQFDDTSTSAGFASNNWQIRANSSASGGGNFLAFVDQGTTGNSETGTIVFEVDAGAPANSLRVSSGGNIGVGTATPVLDVHINTTDTPAIRLEQNNSGGFTAQTWDVAGNEANFFVRDVTSGSRLPFRIRPGAPTSSIDIAANGFVGVGTASPGLVSGTSSQVLEIAGTSNPGVAFRNTNGTARQYFMYVTSSGNNLLNIYDATAAVDRLTLTPAGLFGIGTTAPTDTLSVNGTASKPGGGSWAVFSDERLKNIKGRFNTGLNAVMQLQPIRYEYKSNNALGLKSEGEHVGFAAQSLKQIIPEAVSSTESGYLTVNNDPIIWTMLNAIKEQQKEIEQLKTEVRRLRATARRRK
ncbi:MAG TPA: tail fiber domain-containing protein [Pyrinomonadaceae bacterium]|nr:tail fiber domain-containing protein [Pyrinomonadaceae bacterium]